MVRPSRDSIGLDWPVEVDETLVGGRTRGKGRGIHQKALVVGALEVRTRTDGKKRPVYEGRLRLCHIANREAKKTLTGQPLSTSFSVTGSPIFPLYTLLFTGNPS